MYCWTHASQQTSQQRYTATTACTRFPDVVLRMQMALACCDGSCDERRSTAGTLARYDRSGTDAAHVITEMLDGSQVAFVAVGITACF